MINIIILYHESVIQKICRKNDIFLCHFPTYYFTIYICRYKFHDGAAIFDMEALGKNYLKPEEREVLILMGNKLVSTCVGYDDRYLGKDGQPALMYDIDVYPPEIVTSGNQLEQEKVVYDPDTIKEVKGFYQQLNAGGDFPEVPSCYPEWKAAFKNLVFEEISKLTA